MRTIVPILLVLMTSFKVADTIDYKKEFGDDYKWAVTFLQQHYNTIKRQANEFHIPAKELIAIVFPELIRYNKVYDAIEIESLKYLYISEGKKYADFSVGYFQMKPSFAEMVERDAALLLGKQFLVKSHFKELGNLPDNEANRKARVKRLTNLEQQVTYLCVFYKICEKKFSGKKFATTSDKLKMYATCFNAGYQRTFKDLLLFQSKKQFHSGKFFTSEKYNYADISRYYFENE